MLRSVRMFEVRQKPEMVERALVVRFYFDPREADEAESLLEELGELVRTLEIEVVESVLARSREMHKKLLCGTGKPTPSRTTTYDGSAQSVSFP